MSCMRWQFVGSVNESRGWAAEPEPTPVDEGGPPGDKATVRMMIARDKGGVSLFSLSWDKVEALDLSGPLKADDDATVISPQWPTVLSRTRAVPTHQDAISNAFDPASPLSEPAYARMTQLGAQNVRYLHWTAAGAPIPETVEGTWASAACDGYVSSFMVAPNAETAVVNFNWPSWLHVGNSSENGLRDMTGAELGRWLSKIISWYTKGGFDATHRSPYHYDWRHYEVFNEPHHAMEHWPCAAGCGRGSYCAACAKVYARVFDGVSMVIRADHPELQLHGLSDDWMATMDKNLTWSKEFFSAANHAADARPPEYGSYHFYAFLPRGRELDMKSFNVSYVFAQAVDFTTQARAIRAQINAADWGLGAKTKLNFDEVGLIGGSGCPLHDARGAAKLFVDERLFFNLGASMFAYAYGELAAIGADMVAASQTLSFNQTKGLVVDGKPLRSFYPCLTLIDWVFPYGGNARFWGLKVMIDVLGNDIKSVVAVSVSSAVLPPRWWPTRSIVYAAAFVKSDGQHVVLLANTNSSDQTVKLKGANGGQIHVVDLDNGYDDVPYSNETLHSERIELGPLAIALVKMPSYRAKRSLKTTDDGATVADDERGKPPPSFWHAGWGFISHGGFPQLPAHWTNTTNTRLSSSVVSYFLGNATGMNSVAELAAQARFGIVGIGWQLNQAAEPGKLQHYEIETAKALKALRPDIKVMVSRNTEAAAFFWDSCREKMTDLATQDYWTQCRGKPCAQDWSAPGSRNHSTAVTPGFYYNYSNPALVDWWVNEYVGSVLNDPLIDGVYWDCACIPEPGVRDQSRMEIPAQAAFDKALALIEGQGMWSSSWWGGMLPQPVPESSVVPSDNILLKLDKIGRSSDLLTLGHVRYCNLTMRSWIKTAQNDSNTLQILAPGFSSAKPHTKGPSNTEAENNTIAAFLVARGKNAVLSLLPNENGWSLASDYGWSPLFEMDFGEPLGAATEGPPNVFTRKYSKISPVVLDCNDLTSRFGEVSGDATRVGRKTDDCGAFVPGDTCSPDTTIPPPHYKMIATNITAETCHAKCVLAAERGSGCCYYGPKAGARLASVCEWYTGGKVSVAGQPSIRSAATCTGPPPPPLWTCGAFIPGGACSPDTNEKTIATNVTAEKCRALCSAEAKHVKGCCWHGPSDGDCQWNAGGKEFTAGEPTVRSAATCSGPPPPPPPPVGHEQLHIALGETDDALVVAWASLCHPCRQEAVLHLATEDSLARTTIPAITTVGGSTSSLVSIHRVILTGLQAGKRYNYTVGWSTMPFLETTPRLLEPKRLGVNTSVRLAMFGDLGYTNDQVTRFLRDESAARTIDAIICYGDMVYWWKAAAAAGNPGTGDKFFRAVENMSGGVIPFHVSPGNGDSGGNFSEYRSRWFMPGYEQSSSLWHSFDLGRLHMIGISTEAMGYYGTSTKQWGCEGGCWETMLTWLKADLTAANSPQARALRPWIIVHMHRPMYSTDGAELFGTQRANYLKLENLLFASGVDLVFAGHVHNYERSWPVYSNGSTPRVLNGTRVPGDSYANARAPVYIVSGAVGNAEQHDVISNEWQHWDAFRSLAYGYSHLEVNETHATVDFQSDNLGGQLQDSITLSKDRTCVFGRCATEPATPFAQQGASDPAFEASRHAARATVRAKWNTAAAGAPDSPLATLQRQALYSLFESTGGADWHHVWPGSLQKAWPCMASGQWHGVSCIAMSDTTQPGLHPPSAAGGVTVLQLPSNGLRGVIPDSLGALAPSLQILDLSDNYLSGTVPASLWAMPLLHTLYLMGRGAVDGSGNSVAGGGSRIAGVIPSWRLPNLKYVGLSRNALSGSLPQTIGSSSHLNQLWAVDNQLQGIIPEGVTKLPLHGFYVAHNNFSCPFPCFKKYSPYAELDCAKCEGRTPKCYPCL